MRVIRTVAEMQEIRRGISGSVGLVATLGGIHDGHTRHLQILRPQCDVLIGSLFLNPTQFVANEDFLNYPRDEAFDIAKFDENDSDFVFVPSIEEVYPTNGKTVPVIDPGPVGQLLEGIHRPGHFEGVATVVARLFSIIYPDKATFGEKDAQQLRVIQHINTSLNLGVEIIPIPTVRELDGLAISSRNAYLSPLERKAAPVLFRALTAVKLMWDSGERSCHALRLKLKSVLLDEPLAHTEYATIVDPETFQEIPELAGSVRALLAVKIGRARLIDNLLLE
ncbi:MAG: pantoate--beta-alanine ligase [SAR202 cluster bacterium]|nr:pantoate--beta-alanine ligase [SAR202 cluster bacterium]|tara:strand:- start:4122 stop:4961 length:840 start_codon:yes stop_codon:yes gene_type:complete